MALFDPSPEVVELGAWYLYILCPSLFFATIVAILAAHVNKAEIERTLALVIGLIAYITWQRWLAAARYSCWFS